MEKLFNIRWTFRAKSDPETLWPLLADTNRLFQALGQLPIQEAAISHHLPKGHREFTYEQLHRLEVWEEQPYKWEAPYHLSVKRNYKAGAFRYLLISLDMVETDQGTKITFKIAGEAHHLSGRLYAKYAFGNRFRSKLRRIIEYYDQGAKHADKTRWFSFLRDRQKSALRRSTLSERSGYPGLSHRFIHHLEQGNDHELHQFHALELSQRWNVPLNEVLHVLLHAANLQYVNFEWTISCPSCRQSIQSVPHLYELTDPLYCRSCQAEFDVDVHNHVHLVFKPHPLVRRLDEKTYCVGNPMERPHIKLHQFLYPGQRRFVKLKLTPGVYKLYSDELDIEIEARVEEGGMEYASLKLSPNTRNYASVILSPDANMVIHNQSDRRLFVIMEDTDLKSYGTSATEIASLQLFQNLFPRETLRDKVQIKVSDMTVLFTDILNSTSLYHKAGEEQAIGQVLDHFETLRMIVSEERGGIIKTIGDSIMAVFQKPADALRAFHRAQQTFKQSGSISESIKLKGSIHVGDCRVLTLNNRLDFFGNTINLAARLIDQASSEELIVSGKAFQDLELQTLLDELGKTVNIRNVDIPLKEVGADPLRAKSLSLASTPLRLVV
ncbi:MAG: adenylate/guanylate cyclase domain-containing protein [Balneolaceae bacterium]